MVTDNFGGDVVNIFGSESPFFCESAVKTLISDTATLPYGKLGGHVFQCFDINRGASPDDDVSLITHNFGTEEVTVGQAVNMCETARKTAPDGDEMGWPGRMAMHCFSVQGESDHGPGNSDRGEYALTTENFGVSRVNLIATLFMCEEASKHDADPTTRDVGRPTGRVWQCIEAEEVGRDSPFNASISLMTTNFGEVEVVPDDLVLMCERARKVYSIQAFPVDRP